MGLLALTAAVGATAVALSGWNGVSSGGSILPTADAAIFNAIVPNLSSGWFAKPGPAESLLFGLVILKVMAMRATGLFPYNLNELWQDQTFFQNSLANFDIEKIWRRKTKGGSGRAQRDLYFAQLNKSSKAPLLKEIDTVERILLGLRRIDSHDCFIRHVCQIKQKQISGISNEYEDSVLQLFSLKPQNKETVSMKPTAWDIYRDALSPQAIDCNQKFKMCPLTEQDTSPASILSGLF